MADHGTPQLQALCSTYHFCWVLCCLWLFLVYSCITVWMNGEQFFVKFLFIQFISWSISSTIISFQSPYLLCGRFIVFHLTIAFPPTNRCNTLAVMLLSHENCSDELRFIFPPILTFTVNFFSPLMRFNFHSISFFSTELLLWRTHSKDNAPRPEDS